MTHQKDVPIPEHNQHCQVPKTLKKRLKFLHLTHQMTHGLTYHLGPNFASVSLLAEMAVAANIVVLFNKNYSTRLLLSLVSASKVFLC
jgi:hypothetical protein